MSLLKIKPFIIDDTTANDAFVQANAAFSQANSSGSFANGAFDRANAAYNAANNATDSWVRIQANNAYDTANAAYAQANNSTDSWVRTQANNAYDKANSAGSFANAAFITANTSYGWGNHASAGYATTIYVGDAIANLVNSAPVTLDTLNELAAALGNDANFSTTIATSLGVTNSFANGAFLTANASYTAQNTTATFANGAFDRANAAYTAANTGSPDSLARDTANASFLTANSGASFANASFLRANAAYSFANSLTTTLTVSGNVTANYIIANGSGLTNINAANVSGYVPLANTANTVTNAAQPNITSVGTLTSLTVAGAPLTYSASLSGTTDYVTVSGSGASILGSGDYTVEFWCKTTDTSAEIFASQGGGLALFIAGGVFYVQSAYGSAQVLINNASAITNGNWHHVAVVRNSGTVSLYFDGTSVKTGSDSTDYSGQTTSYDIGYGNQSAGRYFAGYLSNFRIVKNSAVYTSNFTPPTSPLTAISGTTLLTFQNSTFIDNSTSARTITVTSGTPTMTYADTPFPGYGAGGTINASGTVIFSSLVLAQNTTASTSNTTGTIVVTGGVGVKGNLYTGAITVTGSTANGITFADGTTQYTANADSITATSAASFANGAFLRANASYTAQNTTASFANGAFDKANSAGSFSNGAFLVANSASSFANGAFVTANASYTAQNTTASFANSAFVTANASYTAQNTTAAFANGAFLTANSGADFANGAFAHANAAFTAANTGGSSTDSWARQTANAAFIQANAAFAQANTGGGGGGITYTASSTAPSTPSVGDQWYLTTNDVLYEYINDGTSNYWVDITSPTMSNNVTSSGGTDVAKVVGYNLVFGG